jgi:hypothetical protein
VRHLAHQPFAAGSPTARSQEIRFPPGFVEEDEPTGIDAELPQLPFGPPLSDIGAVLFGGPQDFCF